MPRKSSLPPDFCITQRVKVWAELRGFGQLDAHLEYFILTCEANGYQYVNFDSAFMRAIRDDWARLRVKPKPSYSQNIVERGKQAGIEPRPGEEMSDYMQRVLHARH